MKIKNISITKLFGACFLTFLEVQLFDVFEWIKIIVAFLPESLKTLIVNFLDIGIVLTANLWIISLMAKGFRKIASNSKFLTNTVAWFNKNKTSCFVTIFIACVIILSIFVSQLDYFYKMKDYTEPTITVKQSTNTVVKSNQHETPVVYHLYFEDESGIQKIFFDESYVILNTCNANIAIDRIDESHYVLSLSNITGQVGQHQVSIKEGSVMDKHGNMSKEINLSCFYLYNERHEIDITSPQIKVTEVINGDNSLCFNLECTDDNELSSIYIQPNDIITIGFTADVSIEITNYSTRKVILDNISYLEDTNTYKIAIPYGVATDMWGNKSIPYIIDDLSFDF